RRPARQDRKSEAGGDMRATLGKVFHVSAWSWYTFLILSLMAKDADELPAGMFLYGGPWKYLTFLNLVLQMVFFGLAVLNDLLEMGGKSTARLLLLSRDLLFSVFAFPVGVFVVLIFWVIFIYDRQLIFPASLDDFFPSWMNHGMHTLVLPILLGELLLQPHTFPKTWMGLAALGIVGSAYLLWVIWVYLSVGIWVYPMLGLFSTPGLLGFFLLNMFLVILLYHVGKVLDRHLW
ncbi:androgen-dependent TFPI-regulating protein-like, partial [Scleropages formosus]